MTVSSAAKAQFGGTENNPDHDDRLWRFGISLGVNTSHYNILHSNYFLVQDSLNGIESYNSTGLSLAWMVNYKISEHLAIRTYPLNLVFTEKALEYYLKTPDIPAKETPIMKKKVQGISLTLPVHLKFSSDRIHNFRFYVIGGGRFDFDMASNTGKKNNTDVLTVNKFDYGLEGGIGFHFYMPYFVLTPEIKFGYGLNNMIDKRQVTKFSSSIDNMQARILQFTLTFE